MPPIVQHAHKILTPAMHGTGDVPRNYEPLVEIVGDVAAPRVLRVRVDRGNGNQYAGFLAGDPSGTYPPGTNLNSVPDAGIIQIKYGGRLLRTLLCDLQNGDYFLPACENISISAARYKPFANSFPVGDVVVDVELLPAVYSGGDYRPLTCTAYGAIEGLDSRKIRIPVGAYAFDIQTEAYDETAFGDTSQDTYIETLTSWTNDGANGPIFETVRGPYVIRDFQANREQPAGLVALAGHFSGSTANYDLWVTNRAASGVHVCKLIFYVR